jgi:uncharacterized cupin superfamily protein
MTTPSQKPIINIADAPMNDMGNGKQFAAKVGRVGQLLGLGSLGCSVTVVSPGKRAFPFHRHHVQDELFYVVSGTGEYRFGDERLPVRAGDIVAAPAGTKAHQLINTGTEDLRYLAVSTGGSVDIVDYPDSKKVGIAAGVKNADWRTATYKAMGRMTPADYFDGEDA